MPLTKKQKAKEKRSRQSDVKSDLETMEVLLGNAPERGFANHPDDREEEEIDSVSVALQEITNTLGEEFKSLLNSNNRENEMTAKKS